MVVGATFALQLSNFRRSCSTYLVDCIGCRSVKERLAFRAMELWVRVFDLYLADYVNRSPVCPHHGRGDSSDESTQ